MNLEESQAITKLNPQGLRLSRLAQRALLRAGHYHRHWQQHFPSDVAPSSDANSGSLQVGARSPDKTYRIRSNCGIGPRDRSDRIRRTQVLPDLSGQFIAPAKVRTLYSPLSTAPIANPGSSPRPIPSQLGQVWINCSVLSRSRVNKPRCGLPQRFRARSAGTLRSILFSPCCPPYWESGVKGQQSESKERAPRQGLQEIQAGSFESANTSEPPAEAFTALTPIATRAMALKLLIANMFWLMRSGLHVPYVYATNKNSLDHRINTRWLN